MLPLRAPSAVSFGFNHSWVLALLPLALLPLLRSTELVLSYSSLVLMPRDRISAVLGWVLRITAAAAVAATIVGIAGPHQRDESIERIGSGAQIVVVLDRSASMDLPLFNPRVTGAYNPLEPGRGRESKATIARNLLREFIAGRGEDSIALVLFSAFPMQVLNFTHKPAVIDAAISASGIGRGLGDTDIGRALVAAASAFADRPYSASRVIVLVSDGGAQLDPETRREIQSLFKRFRVSLYWIYLRSFGSPGIAADGELAPSAADTVPERFLHKFFLGLPTPYRAYEAEDPQALEHAMNDIGRLERFPIRYREVLPRRDLSRWAYAVALVLTLLLFAAKSLEIRRWV
jgi:mxaC protein